MASFDVVNFSLRANKAIQRSLVFESVRILQNYLVMDRLVYVGLGSIWFTDFQMAHKSLAIEDLISIEADPIGYRRAEYNLPFRTSKVLEGTSTDVLPTVIGDRALVNRPWFVWLDYTCGLEEMVVEDIRLVVENVPQNSVFVVTFNAKGRDLGRPVDRPQRIRTLLGSVVPDDLSREDCDEDGGKLSATLAALTNKFMISVAAACSRPGGFIPAFSLCYTDTTPMVTVGGVLPAKGAVAATEEAISRPDWPGIDDLPIIIPPLTVKEVAALQTQLPRSRGGITRKMVRKLGFDLKDEHIRCFQKYYKYYPTYAQIHS
jgi:hypothetical protein